MHPRQLHYLKAMDIDVWVRKDLPQQAVVSVTTVNAPSVPQQTIQSAPALPAALSWDQLANTVRQCTRCELYKTRKQTVFGVGNLRAEWMIIGEAPGADEDLQGEPFVGRAGQLLNSMLQAIGFPREQVYIANVLKCRPPGNRDPKPDEAASCASYLTRQIEMVNPRVILCLGRIAAHNLLDTDVALGQLRGKVHLLGQQQRPVIVTYHPAYLLRSPLEKRRAWDDLKLALATYTQTKTRSV